MRNQNVGQSTNSLVPKNYGRDEAKGDEVDRQLAAWQVVQVADGKNLSAGIRGHFDRSGSLTDLLVLSYEPDRKESKKAHAVESKLLSYGSPRAGAVIPLLLRQNYDFTVWRQDMDGAMPYAYQHLFGFI